ncbi:MULTISPECIES: TetR/AcrR family transcriptional regulator [unclassified Streptomyces]|uniref:TetR/AcrR family transcriptional regulator n=1 Tax=unclassified Streptomyces TaxID=2593676 RepID=UPI00035C2321|nr:MULTISPECIES: TetR/AcrR family transcriptional regulator [unclassified Streptomyces]MYQ80100.1 TetR family transcriptional regulator [Streptomyces sp. SID4923]
MSAPAPHPRPEKGPRAAEAIFDATLRLLAERGYAGLTIEAVAQEAGVNKTTIYRWWPSKAALLRAALLRARVLDIDVPDTGSLRGDLIALTEQVAALVTGVRTRAVVRALASGTGLADDELAALARDFFADRFAREQPVFARAAARGELPPGADPKLLLDLIAGAVWVRAALRNEPVPAGFAAAVVDAVLPPGYGC